MTPMTANKIYFGRSHARRWGTSAAVDIFWLLHKAGMWRQHTLKRHAASEKMLAASRDKWADLASIVHSLVRKRAAMTRGLQRPWSTATTRRGFSSGAYAIRRSRTSRKRRG